MALASGLDRWRGASFFEVIFWDNLTPQQAYIKQSEALLSSDTLVDKTEDGSHPRGPSATAEKDAGASGRLWHD